MEPIKLTKFNEYLREYPGSSSGDTDKDDTAKLSCCIGVHETCDGWMDINSISKTHKAIRCRNCSLRVVIPISIETYAQLREWSLNLQTL